MVEDLWPEKLESAKIRPPVAILKEQASLLGQKTKNVVEGAVSEVFTGDEDEEETMEYSFNLVAPALGGYRYRLFTMRHDIRMYPLIIKMEEEIFQEVNPGKPEKESVQDKLLRLNHRAKVDTEAEFLALLKKIFAATKTRQIIAAILAQSTS